MKKKSISSSQKDKRGVTTIMLFAVIFLGLFLLIGLFALSYGMSLFDTSMSQIDFSLGNTSFNDTYASNLRPAIIASQTTVPQIIGTGSLFGMVIVMLLISYLSPRMKEIWILLDVLIIIAAEILAVYAVNIFTDFMNSNSQIQQILTTTLSSSSTYLLRLPLIIPIVGSLIILLSRIRLKKLQEEEFR